MRNLALFALAAGAASFAPRAAAGQESGPRCQLRLDHADRGYGLGTDNYFAGGDVRLSCRGTTVNIRSDSLASYASQIIEFIGNVRYEDSSMVMTADRGTYRRSGERWEARGNVVTTSSGGSKLRGPSLDYLRIVPGLRDTVEVYAPGRPTIDYVPRDSSGAEQEPYVIVGDRVRMKGEDRLWAGGRVTIDRSDLAASADSMRLDTGRGQDGALVRNALVRGIGKDSFSLAGNRIDLTLAENELTYVQADGAGRATSADWTLVADTIGLDVNTRVLEQTIAWGKGTRPHAVSTTYEITADSLALDTPAKVLTEARAFGTAWVASGDDTTAANRDWLRGDTVTARFAKVEAAGKSKTVVRRVESWLRASSFYQVKDPARPGLPSLNYARGDRIVVMMRADSAGGVEQVDIQGQVDGVQLEPKAAAARDSTAPADSHPPGSAPMTRPDWLDGLIDRDASLSLALAALVHSGDVDGAAPLDRLVLAYRSTFLSAVETVPGLPRSELSGDQLRESLTASVLPRLADGGWIADDAGAGWATVRATPGWWTAAATDRGAALAHLLATAQEGHVRHAAGGRTTVPRGSVLEGVGLCKSFRQRRVVDNVSVRVEQGEIVALLGPNGAGKTVTFYCLTGIIRPDAGRVLLNGREITGAPMYQRARQGLGYLAQEASVFRRLSVEDNVMAILEMLPLSRAERTDRLEAMLDELSIKHLRKSMAYSLSGGERRRLEITRALVTEPKFMLLDEPFAGVDPIAVNDIQTIVAGLRHRGLGVLITDHNVEQTLDIVDRAYILFEGKVQAAGTVPELVFDDRVAQLYLGPTLTARLRARLENVA